MLNQKHCHSSFWCVRQQGYDEQRILHVSVQNGKFLCMFAYFLHFSARFCGFFWQHGLQIENANKTCRIAQKLFCNTPFNYTPNLRLIEFRAPARETQIPRARTP